MTVQALGASIAARLFPPGDSIRRATVQLAALTVAMVLVMLVALEGVVYVITQQTLRNTLETTLQQRTRVPDVYVSRYFHTQPRSGRSPGPNPGRPPGSGSGEPPGQGPGREASFNPDGPSDTSSVFVDRSLTIVHNDGGLGKVLLTPGDARRVLRSGTALCCTVSEYKGTEYLIYTSPIRAGGRTVGVQQVSISEQQYEQTMTTLLRSLLVVALLGLGLAGLISLALVRRALRPVHIAIRRQRDFVADAAHELRTPLTIMRTAGEVGLASTSPDDLQGTVAQMLYENQHLTRLVEDLSLLARADTQTIAVARERVNLSGLVEETVGEIMFLAEDREIVLDREIEAGVQVQGDALRLRQLLLILLDNALKHTPDGGRIHVALWVAHHRATLRVVDSGSGIPPEALPRIFDRFYRADAARTGEGSGLGLAIGRWIVQTHGGHIGAENVQPHGAAFTVVLPALRPALSPSATPAPSLPRS